MTRDADRTGTSSPAPAPAGEPPALGERRSPSEPPSLLQRYRGLLCDLDGVVVRGHLAIPHAIDALTGAQDAGLGVAYVTNNASRPPEDVVEMLRGLGARLEDREVVTSAQAGAAQLAAMLDPGSLVLAVGGPGVSLAVERAGLEPLTPDQARAAGHAGDARPVAGVLQGYGRDVGWADLAEAAYAVQAGATWVATNVDLTLPTDRGVAPGNGSLVACVRNATGVSPLVMGKPEPPLYELAAAILGVPAQQTLALGDRLDTDIEGAVATGVDSLWVITGVHTPADVLLAPARQRPRFLARDLRALAEPYLDATVDEDPQGPRGGCGAARVIVTGGEVRDAGSGSATQRLRAGVAAGWAALDAGEKLTPDAATRWSAAILEAFGEES